MPFSATVLVAPEVPIVIRSFAAVPSLMVIAEPVTSPTRVMLSFPLALPSLISTVELPLTTIGEPVPAEMVIVSLAALSSWIRIVVPVTTPPMVIVSAPMAAPSVICTEDVPSTEPPAATVIVSLSAVPAEIVIVVPDTVP